MKRYEYDKKSLETAREIVSLVNGTAPIGGDVQLLAQIQLLATGAMLHAAVETVEQGVKS